MSAQSQEVLQQALRLGAVERAELIEALFRSFDAPGEETAASGWSAEAERRIDAHEAGKLGGSPAQDVFSRLSGR